MAAFDAISKKLDTKYGKKDEKEEEKKATDQGTKVSASRKILFDNLHSEMERKYNPAVAFNDYDIRSFFTDSRKFLDSYQRDYEKMGYGNVLSLRDSRKSTWDALTERGKGVYDYLEKHQDQYGDAYTDFGQYLKYFRQTAADQNWSFHKANEYYSQWATEDDYNAYIAQQKDYAEKSSFDIGAGEKEIAALESVLKDYQYLSRWELDEKGQARMDQIRQQYGGEDEIEALISRKKQYLNQARHIQDGLALSGVAGNGDFGQYSGYKSTRRENPAWWQSDVGDTQYEWINNRDGFRDQYEQDNERNMALAALADQSGIPLDPGESEYKQKGYDKLTEQEIGIYNYYYAKEGKEKAQEYLDSIQESLNRRQAEEMFSGLEGNTALELLFGVNAGLDQFKSGMSSLINTEDDYIDQSVYQIASGMVRQDLADNGPKILGSSLGQMGYDAITTTANMAPSIITSMGLGFLNPVLGQVAGTAMMGASATGNAYQEMLNMGYDKSQARAYSALVGGSEAGLQYLLGGIGKLGGKLSGNALTKLLNSVDNAFLRTALKLGGNMASEGLEEGLQEILTPWFQNLIMHTDEKVNWSEVAYSTLLGSLTAGVMEGPTSVHAEVKTQKTGEQLQQSGVTAQRLAEVGKTFSADTVAYQLAGRVDENTGAYTLGRLFGEISAEVTAQNQSDIQKGLMEKGLPEHIARKNAEVFAEVVAGGQFTEAQVAVIEANEVLAQTVAEVIIDPNSTVNQRTKGYNEMLMALAQEKTAPNSSRMNPADPGQENTDTADTVDTAEESGSEGGAKAVSIASIQNRQATVRLEDGSEVRLNEANLDPDEAARIETIAKIDGISREDANFILATLRTAPTSRFDALGAEEAYRYGFYGVSEDYVTKHGAFASSLNENQRKAIYNAGRTASAAQTAQKQAAVAKKAAVGAKNATTGKVHFDGNREALTERQRVSLSVLEKVADALGVQIHVFESQVGESGKHIGANGWYDGKEIHIDLHAGENGEGVMLFTAAHELTHHIRAWSPEKFKTLADFLMQEYGKKGVNVEGLIRNQMDKAARAKRKLTYDEAYEEVVADSMETMLSDGRVLEKLTRLKQKDQSLWQKIKEYISELAGKIRAVYEGMTADSVEGQYVAEMKDAIEKLQDLFVEGLVDASENYQAAEQLGIEIDADSESVSPAIAFSERTWTESDYVQECEKAAAEIAKAIGVSMKKAKAYIDSVNSIAKMIAEDRVRLDYFSSPGRSSFIGNVEYGGSFDFSTLCKKRRLLTGTFTAIQKALPNTALTANEILDIRNRMKEKGLEVSCGLCYVEGSRANMGQFAKEFLRLYKQYYPDAWQPNMADVNTPDGIEWVRINHPECYEQYEYFWNHYGTLKPGDKNLFASQQKPKLYQLHTEYKGEILQKFKDDDNVEEKNLNGGIRLQSFSDFEIVHLIDTMQIIMDMSRVGLAGQAYTKVPDFAWALGDTGLKINLSLIAKGVDGSGKLIFDDVEGMPIDTAVALRNRYSKNVGTILVAFNDEQLLAAMADERVDFIIPFHRSQWKKSQYEAMGLPAKTKDYTYMQNEKFIKPQYHEYRGRMVKDKAVNFMPNEYWDFSKSGKENAVAYLEMCARNNKRPKFYKLLQDNGNGSYSLKADGSTDGYWKLLIDFKMYDNSGNGSPQTPVKPEFNMEEAARMLETYSGGHSNFPVAQGIVDDFVKEYKDSHKGVKFSDRNQQAEVKYSARDYSYETLVSKPDMAVTVVNGIIPNNRADVVALAKKNAAKVGKFDPKTGSVSVYVDDIGTDVLLGRDGLKHGLRRTKNAQNDPNYIVTVKAGEIIKNSIKINEANPKSQSATGAYVMIGAAMNANGDLYIVRSIVNQFSNELASMDVLYAINAKKEPAALNAPLSAGNPTLGTDSIISIADLLDHVNQYFPDILPEEVLKHYGYDARPEGDFGENVLYSDRDSDSVSNRSLLANAFEGVAQNDIEKQKIQEYRGKIDKMNAEEQKLSDLKRQIRELSFAKGPRDKEKLSALRDEATNTANRINIYDKQLLRLEGSKPLQAVLEREKQKAFQRAEKRSREAVADYRKRSAESREKTAMRHKVQNVVGELNKLLLRNDKKHHVPDSLKKAVADALSLVNMDTVGAEERAARYAALIEQETDPDKIDAYTVSMENILRQGEKLGQYLKDLRNAYEEISESDDPDIANAYDPVIAGALRELSQSIGNTSLRDMTIEQLSDVYDMYRMVLIRVRDANKSFLNEKKESISQLATQVAKEVKAVGGENTYRVSALDPVRKFLWNNMKPVYAFETLGSATLTDAFNKVRAGEDVWAQDVSDGRAYFLAKSKKYGYDGWDFKKKYSFESNSGLAFELTLEQILSLYAYSKREQAHEHLRLGGFVFDSNIETYKDGKLIKYKVNTADAHQITPEILADIIGTLSAEQRGFVDEMQDYLSTTMGAKGNEVTMQMYGIKLFKEKNYFPLKSAKQFLFEQNEVSGEVRIKNSGFTNKVVTKANNPVILSNFMEVWSSHVNDMSMYHAFVLPLEDFNRIFNYNSPKQDGVPSVSVKGTIQSAYSPAAVSYVKNLITDLNGGARTDSTTGVINKMMGLFKKGSVFASLSVVVQQPSAVARAAALVDTKYFIGPKVDAKRHKLLWDEVKKYAPVAIIKEMGYFDTNMGKSTRDFILGREYSGIKEKMKALVTDSGYRDEVLSKAPALADELAWCSIWEAVKRETQAKHSGMDVKSEAFLHLAGQRFTEVITKTQVYDSVLSRSANMRSKDTGMKMATAFMAEPTTSINMVADALLQGKRGNRKYARKAIGAVIASQILNSILVSFVYAARDDDEDKTYAEKYIGTLTGEILDSLNPAGYIPFIKDIVSIVQGYDVERSDMAVISDLWNAWQKLDSKNLSVYRKVEGFAGSIAQIFGLPLKNIMRDVRGIYQTIDSFLKGGKTTAAGLGYAARESLPKWMGGGATSDQNQLYEAYLNGDKAQIARVEARYKDQSAINSAIRKALRENDPRIKEVAQAKFSGDLDEYMRLAKEILSEKHFTQDNVVAAINAEINILDKGEGTTSTAQKVSGMFKADDFAVAVSQNDMAMANAIREDIIRTALANGKTEQEAEKNFNSSASTSCKEMFQDGHITAEQAVKALVDFCGVEQEAAEERVIEWAFQMEHGFSYDDQKQQFLDGNISASEVISNIMEVEGKTREEAYARIVSYSRDAYEDGYFTRSEAVSAMVNYGGMTESEAEAKLRYIDIKSQFPDTYVDDAWVDEYYKEVESSGISIDVFIEYRNQVKSINGDGKKERRMAVIDSMPITDEQKDALYYAEGWAASKLWQAPWH